MKSIFPSLAIAVISILFGLAPNGYGLVPVAAWFEGGTLHRATVGEWNRAADSNKLATCADWIAGWEKHGLTKKKYGSMEELRADAVELRTCLNEAVQPLREEEKVAPYAALCAGQLGILRKN